MGTSYTLNNEWESMASRHLQESSRSCLVVGMVQDWKGRLFPATKSTKMKRRNNRMPREDGSHRIYQSSSKIWLWWWQEDGEVEKKHILRSTRDDLTDFRPNILDGRPHACTPRDWVTFRPVPTPDLSQVATDPVDACQLSEELQP